MYGYLAVITQNTLKDLMQVVQSLRNVNKLMNEPPKAKRVSTIRFGTDCTRIQLLAR